MSEASDPVPNTALSPGPSEPEPYRPLSVLALIGFVLGGLYALLILVGGLVALFQRQPWLLPVWVFVVPLGAALLSWLARTRIRDSEGTLGGFALTRWGIGLSLVCGLLYGAYYLATYFAVRQQASAMGDQFVQLLQKGDLDQAFLLTRPPLERQDAQKDPRSALEIMHNIPGKSDMGPFSSFKQAEWVRFLQASSAEVRVRPQGVTTWSHDRSGYTVTLQYHVETTMASFDLQVMVLGKEMRGGSLKGRQWYISAENTGIATDSKHMTEQGGAFFKLSMDAMAHATLWMGLAERGQWIDMYLDTLPPSERPRLRRAGEISRLSDSAAVTGPAPLALQDDTSAELFKGYEDFVHGSLVHADDKAFWTTPGKREEILKKMKSLFDPKQSSGYRFRLAPNRVPGWTRANGELIYSFSVSLTTMDAQRRAPEYMVEANLKVAIPEDRTSETPPPWRVVQLELVAARAAPDPSEPRRPDAVRPATMVPGEGP
jgi:hypothetical protein